MNDISLTLQINLFVVYSSIILNYYLRIQKMESVLFHSVKSDIDLIRKIRFFFIFCLIFLFLLCFLKLYVRHLNGESTGLSCLESILHFGCTNFFSHSELFPFVWECIWVRNVEWWQDSCWSCICSWCTIKHEIFKYTFVKRTM